MQEAQREQFATLTLNTAVELTSAALAQIQPTGGVDEQAVALRDAMRVLFPEAVALVSAARQGFMRESHRIAQPVTLLDKAIVRMLPVVPKPVVQLFSSRYIAGSTLEDAVGVVRALNRDGKIATIDVLGEEITQRARRRRSRRLTATPSMAIERERLDATVSVKLTALGLNLSYDLCRENLEAVLRERGRDRQLRSHRHGGLVDDVGHAADVSRAARERPRQCRRRAAGVPSAHARRHPALADLKPNVRLCKGIYVEPSSIAFTDDDAVRANFVRCLDALSTSARMSGSPPTTSS